MRVFGSSSHKSQDARQAPRKYPFGAEEIRRLEDADYVRWEVPDLNGVSKGKTMTKAAVASNTQGGVGLYGGVLAFGAYSNIVLMPEHRVVSVICDTMWKAGTPPAMAAAAAGDEAWQAANPRAIARAQLEKLCRLGFTLKSAHEYEFRLFDGKTLEPVIRGNNIFNTLVVAQYEEELFEVEANLRMQGVNVETLQSEAGSAQFELTLEPSTGLDAADAAFRFKSGVKEMFQQKGLIASFMTKPVLDEASSSCHFNHSLQPLTEAGGLFSDGKLAEDADTEFKYVDWQLNALARHWMGGLTKHAPALAALYAPTPNCYRRLHGAWAPSHASWGLENRNMMVRLKRDGEEGCYFENRLGCGSSNPYLVLAATVAAGLDGIENKLEPPLPDTIDGCRELPKSLPEALDALENDKYMVAALGEQFVKWFRIFKEAEMKAIDALQQGDQALGGLEAEKKALLRFL
eukprot:jgi/Tetstr1/424402/TSEL_014961.t1